MPVLTIHPGTAGPAYRPIAHATETPPPVPASGSPAAAVFMTMLML